MRVQVNLSSHFVNNLKRRAELRTDIEEAQDEFAGLEDEIAELERQKDEKQEEIDELEQEYDGLTSTISESAPDVFLELEIEDITFIDDLPEPTSNSGSFSIGTPVIATSTFDYTGEVVPRLNLGAVGRIMDVDVTDSTWRVEWSNIYGGVWHTADQISIAP